MLPYRSVQDSYCTFRDKRHMTTQQTYIESCSWYSPIISTEGVQSFPGKMLLTIVFISNGIDNLNRVELNLTQGLLYFGHFESFVLPTCRKLSSYMRSFLHPMLDNLAALTTFQNVLHALTKNWVYNEDTARKLRNLFYTYRMADQSYLLIGLSSVVFAIEFNNMK